MSIYNIKFIKHEEVADGTMAFHFEKPAGFEFKAGQFLEMTLFNPSETDSEGDSRAFSLASAPYEAELMVATRMRDTAFKRVLKTLPIGTEVQIEGPFGDFTLHNNASRPAVFLMGGIGITPVRSIVFQAAQEKSRRRDGVGTPTSDVSVGASGLPHKIFLFYSNRREKDAAFFQELGNLERKNLNYKFIPTMTDIAEEDVLWQGERGYINEQMLKKYFNTLEGAVYYSAGPPAMVAAMRKMLNDAGVGDDDIKTEEFSGY